MREKMRKIVDGLRYNTETAVVIAHNEHWGGQNRKEKYETMYLYRTKKGNYFGVMSSSPKNKIAELTPFATASAMCMWGVLGKHLVEFENAFGEAEEVEEA